MHVGKQRRYHLVEAAFGLLLLLEGDGRHRAARLRMAGTALFGLLLAGAPFGRALVVTVLLYVLAVLGFAWEIVNGAATLLAVAGLLIWCFGIDPLPILLR